ncbi:hypothetical protein SUGI_0272950 [Cryptomeria japonica]|nr:hypothetical protein SUGI_0272950 [Cryptomeria japonica]
MMAFRGRVKNQRWSKILNELDDLALHAVKEIMGEDSINYDFRFRVNCDIDATFVSMLLVMKLPKEDAIQRPYDPLLEDYEKNTLEEGCTLEKEVVKRPILILKDSLAFQERKPAIAINIDFLQKLVEPEASHGHQMVEGLHEGERARDLRGKFENTEKTSKRKPTTYMERAKTSNEAARRNPPHGVCVYLDQSMMK